MINYYILDTSVLLFDPKAISSFKGDHVVIPETVLKELDRKKDLSSVLGKHARSSIRTLKAYSEKGKDINVSIIEGVPFNDAKGTIRIFSEKLEDLPKSLNTEDADNKILSVAISFKKDYPESKVYLVTKDTSLELKALVHQVDTNDYSQVSKSTYSGYTGIYFDPKPSSKTIAKMYENEESFINLTKKYKESCYENGFVILENSKKKKKGYDILFQRKGNKLHLCEDRYSLRAHRVKPLNHEQYFALKLLMDPDIPLVTLNGPAGTGKAQPLDSLVLTPEGFKKMGDIKRGSIVITPKGKESKVVEVFPQGIKPTYSVEFSDGRKVECCKDHLWPIIGMDGTDASKVKTVTLEEFIEWRQENPERRKNRGRVVLTEFPTEYDKKEYDEFVIKPYTLGCLLGDGTFRQGGTVGFSTADQEIINKIQHELSEDILLKKKTGSYDYNLIANFGKKKNRITEEIKLLGLHGKYAHEKFIPDKYMNSSLFCKLEVLRGLFDTEGSSGKRCQDVSFTSTSKKLTEQVQQIIWELGGIAKMHSRVTSYTYKGIKKKGRRSYRLSIRHPNKRMLFSLNRKLDNLKEKDQYSQNLGLPIREIKEIGNKECQCILIDDAEHLYVTDNYVVTHNTLLTLAAGLFQIDPMSGLPYDKVMFARSLAPLGGREQIGFLKGSLEDKLAPWIMPISDNINHIMQAPTDPSTGNPYDLYRHLVDDGDLEITALQYIRGRSLMNTFLIIDEVQNIGKNEIYTIITRIGEGSKVVLLGDNLQVDAPYLSRDDNALVHVIEAFKDSALAGHVTLTHSVRSELAKEATERLIF